MNTVQVQARHVTVGHVLPLCNARIVSTSKDGEGKRWFRIQPEVGPRDFASAEPDSIIEVEDTPLTPHQAAQSLGLALSGLANLWTSGALPEPDGNGYLVSQVEAYRATLATPGGPR